MPPKHIQQFQLEELIFYELDLSIETRLIQNIVNINTIHVFKTAKHLNKKEMQSEAVTLINELLQNGKVSVNMETRPSKYITLVK